MRIEQIIHLDDNDKYLLSDLIPDNPCPKCAVDHKSCCGCPSYDTYSQKIKLYSEAGILEFAQDFKKLNKINSEIDTLEEKFTEIYSSLPPEIKKKITILFNRRFQMNTYSYLKTLQNYNCDSICDNCVLCSKNNGYNVSCASLSEEQIKEMANKIDAKERLLTAEEVPLNEEETPSKEKHKQFDIKPFRWKDFSYNIRVLTNPDTSYRPIMSKMECCGTPLTKLYTNCIIENISGYGIGMLWITTGDGALLYIPWDMIVSIHPIGEKE